MGYRDLRAQKNNTVRLTEFLPFYRLIDLANEGYNDDQYWSVEWIQTIDNGTTI